MSNSHTCSCGHDHSHEHEHAHDHSCGCGCHGSSASATPKAADTRLSANQIHFLQHLYHYKALPVAQYIMKSSQNSEFEVVALSPVFIRDPHDSMDLIKEAGRFLLTLEDKGMLTLDYDYELSGYAYEEYSCSDSFQYFCTTVEEGRKIEGNFGDTAHLERGSMALTPVAEAFIKNRMK